MHWWVVDELLSEIALHSTNKVMILGMLAFGDCSEGVVFQSRGSCDAGQQALLEASLESDDRHFW